MARVSVRFRRGERTGEILVDETRLRDFERDADPPDHLRGRHTRRHGLDQPDGAVKEETGNEEQETKGEVRFWPRPL